MLLGRPLSEDMFCDTTAIASRLDCLGRWDDHTFNNDFETFLRKTTRHGYYYLWYTVTGDSKYGKANHHVILMSSTYNGCIGAKKLQPKRKVSAKHDRHKPEAQMAGQQLQKLQSCYSKDCYAELPDSVKSRLEIRAIKKAEAPRTDKALAEKRRSC